MIIELLRVKVPPENREQYIQKDAEIWTAALAGYPGFLGKEVWINPHDTSEIILIVQWATREQWKAIPQAEIDALDQKFNQELGFQSQIVEFCEYQVRKFPHN
ncbi:cyanobacterial protein, TIGR03792 family [Hapalosiphon sp. MRB220]|nr:cyanobacterial protein, TIGR03792 family [Hapalosiphon sp. MRB220]